jgi:type I restriction enzyme, R subunit
MISNFNFISIPFTRLSITLKEAEQQVNAAPPYAVVLCRKSLEEWVRWLYENDGDLQEPYDTSLNTLLYQQEFKDLLSPSLFKQVNLIRKMGNDAVHTNLKVKPEEALHVLQLMHGFTAWVVRLYSDTKPVIPVFDSALVPKVADVVKTKKQLKELENAFLQSQELNRQLKEELERIKAIKESHTKVPPPHDPNEDLTREIYINLLLKEAGWDHSDPKVSEYPVIGMPTGDGKNNGDGFADYVLWGDDGKPLAVVEAKRTRRDARVGQNQGKLYADCLEQMTGRRPVIFYTNGFETWIWDDMEYAPRRIHGFYKKEELELLVQRRNSRQSLQSAPIDPLIVERYYQIEAIRSVAKVLETRGREALLVMATGTGKTRTAAALVDVMSKANWAKRVLFLADRTALIYQAKNAFNNHLHNLPSVDLTREKDQLHARIVFSTYQTMINQIDNAFEDNQRHFSVGHFDLVIFDEIHRSVYNKYKAIYEYFDAYKIGLTATPSSYGDRDTYLLFGLQPGNPTYAYELDKAVADHYLVPPKGFGVPIKFQRKGIKYDELSKEEQIKYEETFADPLTGEIPDSINKSAINKWLFNTGTVDKVIAHLMENGIKVAGGDRLGKTIIFAAGHKNAKFIEERFNKQYPEYKGAFCKVIDNYEEYAYDILKHFSEKNDDPHIAISVDMLDTGIDVPEIVNLVFFKTVMSRTKFWQMIGRGTRLCKDLLGPGFDKENFVIFDFCENFEFFSLKPDGLEVNKTTALSQRLFEQRLKLVVLLHKQDDIALRQYGNLVQEFLFKQVDNLNDESFLVRQHWRTVEKYKDPFSWNALNELDMKELVDHVSPLVNETDENEGAKRFDSICYNIQLDLLLKRQVSDSITYNVQEIAAKLSKKGAVPAVNDKFNLIKAIQTSQYWKDISISKAEDLRRDLRKLVRFIDKEEGRIIYTDFEDEYSGNVEEHAIVYGTNDLDAYHKRVTHFIQSQQNNITIHKLRMNKPITGSELDSLEKMMFSQGEVGTKEQFERAYGKQPLGKFIRSIVGLDVTAAKEALGKFVNSPALNAQQIKFVDTIIQYLGVNGTIDKGALFSPPFTDISSNGLIDVFNLEQSTEIVSMVDKVNQNALVAI